MTLASFMDLHRQTKIVVCGCGVSLKDFVSPESYVTIGVNDVGRLFDPKYLIVADNEFQFASERYRYVFETKADYCFSQIPHLRLASSILVRFKLGTFCGTDFSQKNVLHYSNTTIYMALCLAALMGANPIGLIGVDFTEHHFFGRTGPHRLARYLESMDQQFGRLDAAFRFRGVDVFNLSNVSRLTVFRRTSLSEFANI